MASRRHWIAGALALAAAMCAMAVATGSAFGATEYRVAGRGWGHGIGMSQYGAMGFANKGWSSTRIIQHYYQGTTVSKASGAAVNVLLRQGLGAAGFGIEVGGPVVHHRSSKWTMRAGDIVSVRMVSGRMTTYLIRNGNYSRLYAPDSYPVVITGRDGTVRTRFTADSGAANNRYRGAMVIRQVGTTISVINRVGLDPYIQGVVPAEMPTSWPAAALQAQSIAARSYALATGRTGIFQHYSDTRSQVYRGIEEETAESNAAVQATSLLVARYDGAIIPAFFHSTSGGRTASIQDVWNSEPRPYLRSVLDPYERSPYSTWLLRYSAIQFNRLFSNEIPGALRGATANLNPSRRADTVTFVGTGGTAKVAGTTVQSRLGARSTYFVVERLTIAAGSASINKGSYTRVHGVIPKSGASFLWYRIGSGRWVLVTQLKPNKYGGYSVWVKPSETRTYAVARSRVAGPMQVIRVS